MLSSMSPLPFSASLSTLLVQQMALGVALFDPELHYVQGNSAFIHQARRFSGLMPDQIRPGMSLFELCPDKRELMALISSQLQEGAAVKAQGIRAQHHQDVSYWDVWLEPLIEDGQRVGFAQIVMEATERENSLQQVKDNRVLTEGRRVATESLRDIVRLINSNQPLPLILDQIAVQARQLLAADSTMIRQVSENGEGVTTVASCNLPAEFERIRSQPFYRSEADRSLLSGEPVVLEDVPAAYRPLLNDSNFGDDLRRAGIEVTLRYYQSLLKVPLFLKDRIFGAVTFHFIEPHAFTLEEVTLAETLADQAALAIENARLIERVQKTATLEERNRLARELHDAVTQTLFSATLTAEVLPKIWERSPEQGRKKLEELRELTRGALAEMRTLLMELRPAALEDADLKDLMRHLTNAFIARVRLPVQLTLEGGGEIPLEVKIAFYRIAQEALNNIARHAEASQVTVSLQREPGYLLLQVQDDGLGFDVGAARPDHFGLGIMRERAQAVGAQLAIVSRLGEGTQIGVEWIGAVPAPAE